ncbi:MAG: hypothetical protein AAB547_02655 [Patescibacteria group bacterium]
MSFENPTPPAEKEPRAPSLEEIRYQVKRFIEKSGQKNPKEQRIFAEGSEGKNVYFYEISTTDDKGDAYLYSYKRAGTYPHSSADATVIEVAYYIGSLDSGIPVGGDILSSYDEASGKWTDIK